jgi:hypothetical protein
MREEDKGITQQPDGLQGRESRPVPDDPPADGPTSWEDNPYRKRGVGWEGAFADTRILVIVALAFLAAPVALVMGVLGGLFLRGPRARRKAWIMAAIAAPLAVLWYLLVSLGKKG